MSDDGHEENGKRAEPTPEEILAKSDLSLLVLLRDQLQKLRIAEGNRSIAAKKLHEDDRSELHGEYERRIQQLEEEITESVRAEMRTHPAWPWLTQIHGVAETSAALVVGYIDIEKCDTVSALWRYAGYGVFDGKRERKVKGEKIAYNQRLKTMTWRLIDLQIKLRGPYRDSYDAAKHRYLTTRGPEATKEWTLAHCEMAARRIAAKLFLSHLWQVWREAEGLPTVGPWIEQYGGSNHDIIDPWEFIGATRHEVTA